MKKTAESGIQIPAGMQFTGRLNETSLKLYCWRLLFLAILGYTCLLGLLLVLITVILWIVLPQTDWIVLLNRNNLLCILLVFLYITKALFSIDVSEAKGYALDRKNFDRLYQLVEKLQYKLNTLSVEKIILVPEFNAAIAQTVSSGILTKKKCTLVIGLELMMATTPKQLTAIIAHELGHLSQNQDFLITWAYRIGFPWFRVMHRLGQVEGRAGASICWFLNGYIRCFNTYYFMLTRHNEYQADALAAEMTSPEVIAHALLCTDVLTRYSDDAYWQKISLQSHYKEQPPKKVYEGLYDFHKTGIIDETLKQHYIDQAYHVETHSNDTHPALKDRLMALNIHPADIHPVGKNAAACFLETHIKTVVRFFSAQWFEQHKPVWQACYDYAQNEQSRLDILMQQHEQQALTGEDLWQLAELTEELISSAVARPLYQSYKANHQD